jgi:hypothetical protein
MEKRKEVPPIAPADIDAAQERVIRQMQRPVGTAAYIVALWVKNQVMGLHPRPAGDNFTVDIQAQGGLWKWSVERPKRGIGARGKAYSADECIDMVSEALQLLGKVVYDEAAPV